MATTILRYLKNGAIFWGQVRGNKVAAILDISSSSSSLADLLSVWSEKRKFSLSTEENLQDLEILSPVTSPCQIICQGKNYLDHMRETGVKSKGYNLLFTKADSSIRAAAGNLHYPNHIKLLDYEIELGLVIGKSIQSDTTINEKNVQDYVAGVVMANDFSARDIQIPERQWFKGKSYRNFCPVGPFLVLLEGDDFAEINNLDLVLKVNGIIKQKSNTKLLMHKPIDTLNEIAQIFDMRPGDLLLTGTPGGVSMRVKPKTFFQEFFGLFRSDEEKFAQFIQEQELSGRYLTDGDVVESSIMGGNGILNLGWQKLVIKKG